MTAVLSHLRTLLVLGRTSNLPTVWSNCLAAWLLNGGASWSRFSVLCGGATLLYIGGMFLNDAFDAGFDRQHRRERPIPSGRISEKSVWGMGTLLLLSGWLMMFLLGGSVALNALLLVLAIVVYDAVHKRTVFAPAFMAACRFLLYIVAAAASLRNLENAVVWHGLALAAYVIGLSCMARGESKPSKGNSCLLLFLLIVPLLANVTLNVNRTGMSWIASLILFAWVMWCQRGAHCGGSKRVGNSVAGLLAGIILVDWASVPEMGTGTNMVFAGLFILALLLQRRIPAT